MTEDMLRIENDALKHELESLRRELRKAEQHQLTIEKVKEELFQFINNLPKVPTWVSAPDKETSGLGIPVLCLSDIHWAEVIDPAQIGGVNEFNHIIATERIKRIVYTAIRLCKDYIARNEYPGIVVPFIGDMMSGDIHEELVNTNWTTSLQAVLELEDVLIWTLNTLADAFGEVYVPCVIGNHTRLTKKPIAKNAVYTNLDWLLYQNIRKHYERSGDKRVTLDIADSLDMQFHVYTTIFHMTHGDQFKGGSGISGALSPLMIGDARKRKRQAGIRQPYDYLLMGHWHQLGWMKGIIINGSIKGYDEFAYRCNFDYEPAQQALFIVHPEHGIDYWMPVRAQELKGGANGKVNGLE